MRWGWLALAFLVGCGGDNFATVDGGADSSSDGPISTIEGGGGDAGDAGDARPDGTTPKPIHRLFVGNGGTTGPGVIAWDDADSIAQDRAPDVQLSDPATSGMILSMEMVGSRLLAFNDGTAKLVGLDNAGAITNGATPAFALGTSAFQGGGVPSLVRLQLSQPGDLLFSVDFANTRVQMFKNASSLGTSSVATTMFGSGGVVYGSIARDTANDRLFVGNMQLQIVQFVNGVSQTSGTVVPTNDFAGTQYKAWAMAIDGVRLYVLAQIPSMNDQVAIQIYNLSGIHAGSQPDATVTKGLPTAALPLDMVLANDTLVVSYTAVPSRAVVFTGAKSLGSQSQGVPLTTDDLDAVRMRFSEKTGRLYVAGKRNGAAGVFVYRNISNTPVLQASLTSGTQSPRSLALYEP